MEQAKFTPDVLRGPRLVKVLGADARIPSNDEEIDRGPLTQPVELYDDAAFIAADHSEDENKAQRRADMELARAKEAQINSPEVWRLGGAL